MPSRINPITKPIRGIQLNRLHPLARGMRAGWLLNEYHGDIVYDITGSQCNGILDDVSWGNGGLDFANAGAKVDCTNLGTVEGIPALTAVSGILTGTVSENAGIVCKRSNAGAGYSWQLWTYSSQFYGRVKVSGTAYNVSSEDLADNTYYNVAFVADGEYPRIYTNGQADGVGSTYSGNIDAGDSIVQLGYSFSDDYDFNGIMYYAYIYDRALSVSEVQQINYDPYCMFGRSTSIYYKLGGGISIPVAMHHFMNM